MNDLKSPLFHVIPTQIHRPRVWLPVAHYYLRPELAAGVGICSLSHECALPDRQGFSLLFSSHLDIEVAREIEKSMLLDCVRAWFEKPDTAVTPVSATAIDENVFNKTSKISTFAIATQSLFLKNETYNQS